MGFVRAGQRQLRESLTAETKKLAVAEEKATTATKDKSAREHTLELQVAQLTERVNMGQHVANALMFGMNMRNGPAQFNSSPASSASTASPNLSSLFPPAASLPLFHVEKPD